MRPLRVLILAAMFGLAVACSKKVASSSEGPGPLNMNLPLKIILDTTPGYGPMTPFNGARLILNFKHNTQQIDITFIQHLSPGGDEVCTNTVSSWHYRAFLHELSETQIVYQEWEMMDGGGNQMQIYFASGELLDMPLRYSSGASHENVLLLTDQASRLLSDFSNCNLSVPY